MHHVTFQPSCYCPRPVTKFDQNVKAFVCNLQAFVPWWWYHHENTNTLIGAAILKSGHPYGLRYRQPIICCSNNYFSLFQSPKPVHDKAALPSSVEWSDKLASGSIATTQVRTNISVSSLLNPLFVLCYIRRCCTIPLSLSLFCHQLRNWCHPKYLLHQHQPSRHLTKLHHQSPPSGFRKWNWSLHRCHPDEGQVVGNALFLQRLTWQKETIFTSQRSNEEMEMNAKRSTKANNINTSTDIEALTTKLLCSHVHTYINHAAPLCNVQ